MADTVVVVALDRPRGARSRRGQKKKVTRSGPRPAKAAFSQASDGGEGSRKRSR